MNRHVNLPPTEMGMNLNLPKETADSCRAVYEETADKKGYQFKGAFNPEVDYGDKCIIVPVSSIFKDIKTWNKGTVFANVLGSTGDEHPDAPTWKRLYGAKDLPWEPYEEQNAFYDSKTDKRCTEARYVCGGGRTVGGHVVLGKDAQTLPDHSDVYVVPICSHHNSMCINHGGDTPGNGNGFYMKTKADVEVLLMQNYLPKSTVMKYDNSLTD